MLVVSIVFVLLLLFLSFSIAPYKVRSYEETKAEWRSSDAWLLDRNGEPLSRIRIDRSRRRWLGDGAGPGASFGAIDAIAMLQASM
jgi:hypothetical protein